MASTSSNLALTQGMFQKCAPSISTNIKECGSVTLCNAKPMTFGELSGVYTKSGDYRVMGALLRHDFEIRMCEAKQNGLYEFFMANKMNMSKKLGSEPFNSGLIRIRPFVRARQYSQINNKYYLVTGGTASGGNWQVNVASSTNIPADVRSFPTGQRVYIKSSNAGTATSTAWTVVTSTLTAGVLTLVLSSANAGSFLPASRTASPVTGVLMRGTANVQDYEKFCAEPPAFLNWKDVPFFVETQRTTLCNSENYDKWRKLLMAENPLYREYGDLDEIQRNKQLAQDWEERQLQTMIWGTASSAFQDEWNYDKLPDVTSFAGGIFDAGGAQCVGKKADMVGLYEQMVQCNRVFDCQGADLNLTALFNELYNIIRIRESSAGGRTESIDIFTDSITARKINTAMIGYYNTESGNSLRLTMSIDGLSPKGEAMNAANKDVQKAEFGFNYRSYNLFYPAVRINICTHYFFDDYLTAQTANGTANAGRLCWVLDMAGIYPGIVASNRKVWKTGDLKTLAAIDNSYACVMEVFTQQQTLMSVTGTMVVQCPAGNLLLENFSANTPVLTAGTVYPGTTTTTTTTTSAVNF